MTKTKKDRHHYIPEIYSKNFMINENKPQVWVYEKGSLKPPYYTSPTNFGVERYYYGFDKKDGRFDTNSFEDMFNLTESVWPDLVYKINKFINLSTKDIDDLLTFVALMRVRTPNFRLQYKSFRDEVARLHAIVSTGLPLDQLKKLVKNRGANTDDSDGLDDAQLKQIHSNLKEGIIKLSYPHQISLNGLEYYNFIRTRLMNLNWSIATHNFSQDFITSDNPLTWYSLADINNFVPYKEGLDSKLVEVIFPVTKRLLLIGNNYFTRKFSYGEIKSIRKVKQFNRFITISAERFVYSSQDHINILVQRYKDSSPKQIHEILQAENNSYYLITHYSLGMPTHLYK